MATGVIYNPKLKKCLILQRSKKEIAHPGLWGVVGGKLGWKDLKESPVTRFNFDIPNWEGLVEKLLEREAREECGLEVADPKYLESVVFIRPDNIPVVCMKYAVKLKGGKLKLAPEFDDFAWVDGEEVKKYEHVQGIDREIRETLRAHSS